MSGYQIFIKYYLGRFIVHHVTSGLSPLFLFHSLFFVCMYCDIEIVSLQEYLLRLVYYYALDQDTFHKIYTAEHLNVLLHSRLILIVT